MERNKLSALLGEYAEEYAALRFMDMGYEVFKNWVSDGTDLLVFNKGRVRRIQVKCSKAHLVGNHHYYSFQIKRKRSKGIYEGVDYFVLLGVDSVFGFKDMWLIPRRILDDKKGINLSMNLNPKKNKEYKKYYNHWVVG